MTQPDTDDRRRTRPLFLDRNLLVIFAITLVVMIGVSAITPALPAVSRAYGISAEEVGWLIAAFALPGIVLAPLTGLLGDRYGRKRVIVPSLVLFSVAGGACALVGDFQQLIVLRLLQGVGGAALNTLSITLVGDLYRGHERAAAMGYLNGFIAASAAGYPLLGGVLTLIDWRVPFALSVVGLPVAVLVVVALKNPELETRLSIGLYLRRMAANLVQREFLILYASGFVLFAVLYGALITYLPFLLERNFGLSAFDVGLVLAANAVTAALTSVFLGALSRRIRRRHLANGAFMLTAVSLLAIAFTPDLAVVVVAVAITGGSLGLAVALLQLVLTERAPMEQRGAIMALNGMMFRLGQTVGPLILGAMLAVGGMQAVFIGAAVLAALPLTCLHRVVRDRQV